MPDSVAQASEMELGKPCNRRTSFHIGYIVFAGVIGLIGLTSLIHASYIAYRLSTETFSTVSKAVLITCSVIEWCAVVANTLNMIWVCPKLRVVQSTEDMLIPTDLHTGEKKAEPHHCMRFDEHLGQEDLQNTEKVADASEISKQMKATDGYSRMFEERDD